MPHHVTFILVRPHNPGNIGSAARAIANFGFRHLAVVQPTWPPSHPEAARFAVSAAPLLRTTKVADSIAAAAASCHYLIGTSRRQGKRRAPFLPVASIATLLDAAGKGAKIGILFGPEEKGLTNDELAMCHAIVTIPSHPKFPSLNLAHAVAIVGYEIAKALRTLSDRQPARSAIPATTAALEGMYAQLETTLASIGFFPHGNAARVMRTLRRLFGRAQTTVQEMQLLRAVCQQIVWKIPRATKTGLTE